MVLNVYSLHMGAAANVGQRAVTAATTLGLTELPGGAGKTFRALNTLNPLSGFGSIPAAIRTTGGVNTAMNAGGDAARNAASMNAETARQGAQLQQELERRPKVVNPDLLSEKNKALTKMRLGIASTLTGAGGAPAPGTFAPSLGGSNTGGKVRLGS